MHQRHTAFDCCPRITKWSTRGFSFPARAIVCFSLAQERLPTESDTQFAERVQRLIADALGIEVTTYTYRDKIALFQLKGR